MARALTHGYRHFSFLTYIVVLYLAALRGVRVRGAYYGLLRQNGPSPFLDLRPLLDLPRWLHALEVLRETGSTLPLATALDDGPRNQSARSTEAAQHAGYAGKVEALLLEDPYGGRPEIDRLVEAARERFLGADEVLVNVTGGTTLMGLVAEALAVAARKLACPVRRFGLIDRRPPEQQDTDPYRMGEPFWLDSSEGDDADGD